MLLTLWLGLLLDEDDGDVLSFRTNGGISISVGVVFWNDLGVLYMPNRFGNVNWVICITSSLDGASLVVGVACCASLYACASCCAWNISHLRPSSSSSLDASGISSCDEFGDSDVLSWMFPHKY